MMTDIFREPPEPPVPWWYKFVCIVIVVVSILTIGYALDVTLSCNYGHNCSYYR